MEVITMLSSSDLVRFLVAVIAVLVALLCGIAVGLLKRLDGGSVAMSVLRAGAAVGACLTVEMMALGLLLGK